MHSSHTAARRRARPVHYRRVRQPERIWLQPQASCVQRPTRLHPSIILAAVAIGLIAASIIASLIRWL